MDEPKSQPNPAERPPPQHRRRVHPKEAWVQARRDYEAGGYSAREIADYYGMTHAAVERRAYLGTASLNARGRGRIESRACNTARVRDAPRKAL
ncbi:MAG: hypothetical protein K2P58_07700 [Hyphomonadaceae bacterium]|nr:hypothetical protein [Hyphomonadaceae bacterium]